MKLKIKMGSEFLGRRGAFFVDLCGNDGVRLGIITDPDVTWAGFDTRNEAIARATAVRDALNKREIEVEL